MDLIVTGGEPLTWEWGRVLDGRGGVSACDAAIRAWLEGEKAGWVLFWDATLGMPDLGLMQELAKRPVDVWHGGLRMGTGGLPGLLDFVSPCWMLHRDPPAEIEASSWRLSLRCALVRRELLQCVGGVDGAYRTLAGAGLDLGYRCLCAGAMMRHVPGMAGTGQGAGARPPLEDEARWVAKARGLKWLAYGLGRAVLTGDCGPAEAWRAWRGAAGLERVRPGGWRTGRDTGGRLAEGSVTVLIPTVDRYPYLRTVLRQLAAQTVPPVEVVVVDQTDGRRRERDWHSADGLRLRVIEQEKAGQCTSRNAGLRASRGEWILFLDDDDEVEPDLVERFLRVAAETEADVVCGVAEEAGAGALPEWFRLRRMSDVFPTNAGMVRREALVRSGLFDLAYNRGARADGDLGMRLYRSGALMVLDPELRVLHHHALQGGLRKHKARKATYAASRASLWVRHLPERTELYLRRRYFSERQCREALWMSVLGTLAGRGCAWRRALKAAVGAAQLPHTLWVVRKRDEEALRMMGRFPQIERLEEAGVAACEGSGC
jgi:glycosyltransferase involved in cell wall biosynthesis